MADQSTIAGSREHGMEVRVNNLIAIQALANIVKSSLGPQGLDKMLVDDIGDVTITNDGATILKQLEVVHPAAKVIVELSQLQDKEVGDGTTSVVILAAELLKKGNDLIKNKVHPTNIIAGYKLALVEAVKFVREYLAVKTETLGLEGLGSIARTSMSSKLLGPESGLFSSMVVQAAQTVKTPGGKIPIKNIHIVKAHGQSSIESKLFEGYVLQTGRSSQLMRSRVENAKIACLDVNLNKFRLNMGIQVVVTDPKNLEKIRQAELDILKNRCQKILDSGANVVLTTKGLDDVAAKYLVEGGALGLRRVSKQDMRRLAAATGATIVSTFSNNEGEEVFDKAFLGEAAAVYEEALGDNDFVFFKGLKEKTKPVCTLVVRGANEFMVDEVERSLHDALCVVKRTLESGYAVAGGGSCEMALAIHLEAYASSISSKEQLPIVDFAESLSIIPKILANNAALDSTELVSKLRSAHHHAQTNDDAKVKEFKYAGLDLVNGKIRNNLQHGVIEPMVNKLKSLKFATEAAITVLRIDDMIKLTPQKEDLPRRR